ELGAQGGQGLVGGQGALVRGARLVGGLRGRGRGVRGAGGRGGRSVRGLLVGLDGLGDLGLVGGPALVGGRVLALPLLALGVEALEPLVGLRVERSEER